MKYRIILKPDTMYYVQASYTIFGWPMYFRDVSRGHFDQSYAREAFAVKLKRELAAKTFKPEEILIER